MEKQILYEPFPKQMEFLEAAVSGKYKYILYGGAIRGGKTFGGLGTLLILCKLFPFSRWAIVRDSLPTLKRNTIQSFNKICPQSFIKSYNQDTQTVTFTNGSQIIFFAENFDDDKELNRWRGLEVNGFLLEEANELQELSFNKAIERAGSYIPPVGNKKPKPLILLTCNPSQGWVKDKFYTPNKNGTLPPDFLYISAKITDNPAVTADLDYMASLKNMPRFLYEVFVEGNWDINYNEYPWLHQFDREKQIKEVPFLNDLCVYLNFDINNDPFACVATQHSAERGGLNSFIHHINEFGGKVKVDDMCDQILSTYPSSIFYVTGDRSGLDADVGRNQTIYGIIQSRLGISEAQMNLNKNNLEYADSRLLCNTMFAHYPNTYIHPRCKNLISDCERAACDVNASKSAALLKNRKDYKMDYFDGMRYYYQTYWLSYCKDTYLRAMQSQPVSGQEHLGQLAGSILPYAIK